MKHYFCRNPECFSKPWRSVETIDHCPTCGSSMVYAHRVDWAHKEDDYGGFLTPSPEQERYKDRG